MPSLHDRKAALEKQIADRQAQQKAARKEELDARAKWHQVLGEMLEEFGLGTYTDAELRRIFVFAQEHLKAQGPAGRNGHAPTPLTSVADTSRKEGLSA